MHVTEFCCPPGLIFAMKSVYSRAYDGMVTLNELVMTASQGEAFRNFVNNGGARSDPAPSVHAPVNFHVHALDAQGVASFLQGNGREIMKAVGRHVQDGLHLGVRG